MKYVMLVKWTEKGVKEFSDTTDRMEQARKLTQSKGGTMIEGYWTMGRYDLVVLAEAPDDETAAAVSMAISSGGNVRVETMRAFTSDEMKGIVKMAKG